MDNHVIRGEIAAKQYTEEILNHNGIKLDSLRLKGGLNPCMISEEQIHCPYFLSTFLPFGAVSVEFLL